ncbi:hypothetical protein [Acidimangrovimonas pyrenivorans]|uniref:Uncharacterized protein n=1 Tax=Acidimangrovimonas pyrenivorans TaxID=2030798 RepID=A0ABV7ALK9_9RHOB
MTVHIPQKQQDALYSQYLRFQSKVAGVAEKEHKAQLKRRRHVLDAFGKWLDAAPRVEILSFLERLSEVATVADRKRIAAYLEHLPEEEPDATEAASEQVLAASRKSPEGTHSKQGSA